MGGFGLHQLIPLCHFRHCETKRRDERVCGEERVPDSFCFFEKKRNDGATIRICCWMETRNSENFPKNMMEDDWIDRIFMQKVGILTDFLKQSRATDRKKPKLTEFHKKFDFTVFLEDDRVHQWKMTNLSKCKKQKRQTWMKNKKSENFEKPLLSLFKSPTFSTKSRRKTAEIEQNREKEAAHKETGYWLLSTLGNESMTAWELRKRAEERAFLVNLIERIRLQKKIMFSFTQLANDWPD